MIDIELIRAQREKISPHINRTPSIKADKISHLLGCDIYLKLENMHYTGSFKERGALSKLLSLDAQEKERGICAVSAGNHAQSLAYHAGKLGIKTTVVMPNNSPFTKIEKTEKLGAKVIFAGNNISQSIDTANQIISEQGLIMVHPYDDDYVRAGQASVALELLEDISELDCLIVPIGGGGLISGIAVAAHNMNPKIEIYGVQSMLCPSTYNELKSDQIKYRDLSLADGISVKQASEESLKYIRKYISDIFLVSERDIENSISLLLSEQKILAEGAAATPLAALINNNNRFKRKKTGLIISGGNIDIRLLSSVIMRELDRKGGIASLRISVPDQPGMLGEITKGVGDVGLNILDVSHTRLRLDVHARNVEVDLIVEAKDKEHLNSAMTMLKENNIKIISKS